MPLIRGFSPEPGERLKKPGHAALACFQPLRCPVLIGTMSPVTPASTLPPRTLQVFPGLWLLLSVPQWDYVGLWREERRERRRRRREGAQIFPADHIRNGSLGFLHKFCSLSDASALIRPSRDARREQAGGGGQETEEEISSVTVY